MMGCFEISEIAMASLLSYKLNANSKNFSNRRFQISWIEFITPRRYNQLLALMQRCYTVSPVFRGPECSSAAPETLYARN